ncbi:YqzE family protein [Pradoshia eiseniae]|uniref:YqzE family protein n=1 Tax=Pradoshia eiseniae TaxID=2064768 RepID=A0A2S7N3I2_9BACI|nr:YqzE family protein [Pradoshia eiseniae]PQD96530.1 YqzE family protein [Pradoshia eiseniae]
MKTNDYVKYLTVEWLNYMDQPKEIRKEQRKSHKGTRQPISFWFGVIPLGIEMLFKRN